MLTQFKSNSLIEHITRTWRLVPEIGQYVDVVPAQMRKGPFWFRGTADAVFQNLELIFDEQPEYVCVFGGDHIYKMDVNQMLQEHLANDADLTIATIPVPVAEAHHFGIVEIDSDWRVTGFVEKPKEGAKTIPGRPDMVLASMGNYIFKASVMIDVLQRNALRDAAHDFGKEIIPAMYPRMKVYAYDFAKNFIPGEAERQPRLLARRRDDRLVLRGVPRPGGRHAALQPLQRAVADRLGADESSAGEVRLRRREDAAHRNRHRLDGLRRRDHLRRHDQSLGVCIRGCASIPTRTSTSRS